MMTSSATLALTQFYKKLGFKEHPFLVSADPRFLFLSSQHQVVLEAIQRVVVTRQGLAVVEGAVGVGKTTLARRLYDMLRGDEKLFQPLYIHTATYKSTWEAMSDIAARLGVARQRSEKALTRAFERWLIFKRAEGQMPVIIIDDAQHLGWRSLNAFQYIYNFDVHDKLAQVIMFGQSEIRELIAQNSGLLSRVVSWQTILPLPPGETLSMINFRCAVAGRTEPLLEESAFYRLYEYSGGLPRTIVIVCSDILSLMERAGKTIADEAIVNEAIENHKQRPEYQPARSPVARRKPAAPGKSAKSATGRARAKGRNS
jgi:general secretion pathway protein A